MKKRIALFLALILLVLPVFSASAKTDGNYIWILEAEGTGEDVLASGIAVKYSVKMLYTSLAGHSLTDYKIPTRFNGSAAIYADYVFPEGEDGEYTAWAQCYTATELPNFQYAYDGSFATSLDFHSLESSFGENEALYNALGGMHAGLMPGHKTEHGYGNQIADIYVSAEPDESELGYGKSYGVRALMILATVFGSEKSEDEFSFEMAGTLKRLPCTYENIYSARLSQSAPKGPEIEPGSADGAPAAGEKIALSRLRSFVAGNEYWPFEAFPEYAPEFSELYELTKAAFDGQTAKISLICTSSQLSQYKKDLKAAGFAEKNGAYVTADCYLKISSKNVRINRKTYLSVTLTSTLASEAGWHRGFELFPSFDSGCIVKAPHGDGVGGIDDYAWMSATAYGADENDGESYAEMLTELGFVFGFEEWSYTSEDGYRYSFNFAKTSDDTGSGLLLTFYVIKDGVDVDQTNDYKDIT